MAYRILLAVALTCLPGHSFSQHYAKLHDIFMSLHHLANPPDSSEAAGMLNKIWCKLVSEGNVPVTDHDSVMFLYRGAVKSVRWIGDFNAWGYDKTFQSEGTPIPGTDIWYLKASFSTDARLDYKIVLDKKNRILDPNNLRQQWSGVGSGSLNSELRMPRYEEDSVLSPQPGIPQGRVTADILFQSKALHYQITYSVYQPAIEGNAKLPVVYVTDGYEYMHPKMGNMITVLDNLIASGRIQPIIAVFIDHREPGDRTNNRRMLELTMNADYLKFFTEEFIPQIERNYPVIATKGGRAIMGASQGGLNATYFLFSKPEVFGFAGIQSPSFWNRPQIYKLCENPEDPTVVISMTTGTINDASDGSRKMKAILEANSCIYHYREVNEGPSWGNWKNLIDDILVDFFAIK
jgi:enterochelin esterase family protein